MKAQEDSATPKRRTLHVIQCLAGNDKLFLDEWEYNLKSVLVNAPLDSNLHVHIIADDRATHSVKERIATYRLENTSWRNEVSLTLNNVEEHIPIWISHLNEALTNETTSGKSWIDRRLGIGSYFRLFAHRVILSYEKYENNITSFEKRDLEEAVYMDTDVVVIANMNNLMDSTHKVLEKKKEDGFEKPLWIWNQNSGFMVMDLTRFEHMWELANMTPSVANSVERKKCDQWILAEVQNVFPNATGILPTEWTTTVGHGFRMLPHNLLFTRKDVGMLHFTSHNKGNWFHGDGTDFICQISKVCNHLDPSYMGNLDRVRRSWGLAEYYGKMTWDWAFFQVCLFYFNLFSSCILLVSLFSFNQDGHQFLWANYLIRRLFIINHC